MAGGIDVATNNFGVGYDKFNEATRVQIPALIHLNRLEYKYFGKISENMAILCMIPRPIF